MKNADGEIIYIGKAKALKNRVSSYFHNVYNHEVKTFALVSNIDNFEYIITSSEFEALLLESSLIKNHTPKYNILLKDDKGYPYVKLTMEEDYPRLKLAPKRLKDKSLYFGPFSSRHAAFSLIDTVNRIFKLPDCGKNGHGTRGRECLNYHIDRCVGICQKRIPKEEYRQIIDNVISFLNGQRGEVIDALTMQMNTAAENMQYEKAAYLRDNIKAINALANKQKMMLRPTLSCDCALMLQREGFTCVTILQVKRGVLLGALSRVIETNEDKDSAFSEYLCRYYETGTAIPPVIYLEKELPDRTLLKEYLSYLKGTGVNILIPQKGDGKALVKIAQENAAEYLINHIGQTGKEERELVAFSNACGINSVPKTIEMYDISHTSGDGTVCGCICFTDGKKDRNKYKKYNIQNILNDDCAAMTQAVERRISRYKAGDPAFCPLPDLLVLDGGITQLNAVKALLERQEIKIRTVALKKDLYHRTKSILLENGNEIPLIKNKQALFFASRLQNEVHRFALEHHKKKRSKAMTKSILTDIEGIGGAKAKALMTHFKSIKAVSAATEEQLEAIKGINKKDAQRVRMFFNG